MASSNLVLEVRCWYYPKNDSSLGVTSFVSLGDHRHSYPLLGSGTVGRNPHVQVDMTQ